MLSPNSIFENNKKKLKPVFKKDPLIVITKTSEFSNESVHHPGVECLTEYSELNDGKYESRDSLPIYMEGYEMHILANKIDDRNEGYVCVMIKRSQMDHPVPGTCFISVIDSSGIPRFGRSFTTPNAIPLSRHEESELACINYIKRATLLADPVDLLPNDTLTLQIDFYGLKITLTNNPDYNDIHSVIASSLKIDRRDEDSYKYSLLLDSPIGNILSNESFYFKRMLDTEMLEKSTRRMNISLFEFRVFKEIGRMLLCDTRLVYSSACDILEMYFVADKYDIPYITETCKSFLKLYLSDHSFEDLWNLANGYINNETLTVSLQNLVSQLWNAEEMKASEQFFPLKQTVGNCEWVYKNNAGIITKEPLVFENRFKTVDFDFYK